MDKCQKIVHPLKKGAQDYGCRREHYKDGWCKQHNPELVALKERKQAEDNARWKFEKALLEREREAQRLFDLAQLEKGGLTIETAIVLLVQSGYRVEKLPPNVKVSGGGDLPPSA